MSDVSRIGPIVECIRPLLSGQPAGVQGAVLADLLAIFLAGHRSDTPAHTEQVREAALAFHIETVRKLIPVNAALMDGEG
jgi:hypothetical protein